MQSLQHGQFFVASCVRFVDSSATLRSQFWIANYDFESKREHLESHRAIAKGITRCRQEDVFEEARSQSWMRIKSFSKNMCFIRRKFLDGIFVKILFRNNGFTVRFVDWFATPWSQSWMRIYDFSSKIETLESHRVMGKGITRTRQNDVFEGAWSQSWMKTNRSAKKKIIIF